MPGFTVGILDQEPALDESKTVLGNVEDGVAETKAMLARYNEIAEELATDYSDELLEEMGKLQEQLDHRDAWDLDSQLEQAMDALRCPPPDADVRMLSGGERRRVALCSCCCPSRTCCCWTSRPTTWTRRACSGWSSTWRSTRAPSWRSPTTGTSWTTWRSGSSSSTAATPIRTRATTPPTWRPRRPGSRSRARRTPSGASGSRTSWSGCGPAPGPGRPRAGRGCERYEEMAAEADEHRKLDFEEIQIPPGPRLGNLVVEARTSPRASATAC